MAKDTLKRIASEECFVRNRVAELATLLYNTAASVETWATANAQFGQGLNPTPGSKLVHRRMDPMQNPPPLPEARGSRSISGSTPNSAADHPSNPPGSNGASHSTQAAPNQFQQNTAMFQNLADIPVQQIFEATGFADNSAPNTDFLGQVGGVFDANFFPEGLLDFGAWSNFFASDPNQAILPDGSAPPPS